MFKLVYIAGVAVLLSYSCQNKKTPNLDKEKTNVSLDSEAIPSNIQSAETVRMASRLKQLVIDGNPDNYLHWNNKKAELMRSKMEPYNYKHNQLWFQYCTELLFAGRTSECITELESHFDLAIPFANQMNPHNAPLFDLLAIAYLRQGEQENCQNDHNEFSCILPLQEKGIHKLPAGSSKAAELYQDMFDKTGIKKYKWLINLAYMTLGKYPDEVPSRYYIPYFKDNPRSTFKRFKEVAMNVNVAQSGLSGGVCIEDFNNDGILDIFCTAYGMEEQSQLFINDGKGAFENNTSEALLDGISSGLNCIQADYNNDGDIDILVLRGAWLHQSGKHPNSLLKNNGDGTFQDVTASAGILTEYPTQTACWADFNKDGYLDLFIGNESGNYSGAPCEFYQNNGDGTFTNVIDKVGIGQITQFVKGVTWGDINNDTWPDLFISVSGGGNILFKNNNGHFENISGTAGIKNPEYSFATWFWDVNNDGYQDLFVAGYDTRNFGNVAEIQAKELEGTAVDISLPRLYINNKDETFSDKTTQFGLDKPMFAMGANFGDLDNDGYLDFYLGTGSPEYTAVVPNRMFRNINGEKFEEVTSIGGFGHIQKGHGVAFADIDQDGDQDIYAVMGGAFEGDVFSNVLFENPGFDNNWIIIELEGVTTNRSALQSSLELQLNNGKKVFINTNTGGSFGSNSLQNEIGLGKATKIEKLIIHWQNSEAQIIENVEINQKLKIKEGQDSLIQIPYDYIPFSTVVKMHHHI